MKIVKSVAAAAFAVASFVPVASVGATTQGDLEVIDSVSMSITLPTIGSTVGKTTCSETYDTETHTWDCPDTKPVVTVPSGAHYVVENYTHYNTALESSAPFYGTFAANTDYFMEIGLSPEEGYAFNITTDLSDFSNPVITNHMSVSINGADGYVENSWNSDSQYMVYVKVHAVEGSDSSDSGNSDSGNSDSNSGSSTKKTPEVAYKTLNGGDQTFYTASDSGLTFRFDIDFDEFKNSGAVFIDGNRVDSSNYTAKSGSTIVTFNDSYTGTLSAGAHTIRVATANGEATASFTIKKSANPKTGLDITSNFVLLGASLTSLAGAATYAAKKSRHNA